MNDDSDKFAYFSAFVIKRYINFDRVRSTLLTEFQEFRRRVTNNRKESKTTEYAQIIFNPHFKTRFVFYSTDFYTVWITRHSNFHTA